MAVEEAGRRPLQAGMPIGRPRRAANRPKEEDRTTKDMPRQHINYSRDTYHFPDDFPLRLRRFREESGMSQAELARRLGTYPHTVWRWTEGLGRPNARHLMALLDLADDLGLGHLFTD